MQETSRRCSRRLIYLLTAMIMISAMTLGTRITASAAVKSTDINTYIRANGDSYSGLSDERKKGYEIGKNDVMNSTQTHYFSSTEEIMGHRLYMYDHPAVANNADALTKAQAAATLSKAAEIVSRCTGSTLYEQALSLHDLLCEAVGAYGCPGGQWGGQSAYEAIVNKLAVCNGYATAYKLLCDLKGIPCHIVYGYSVDGTKQESHAWNVIKLDDGQWYEVDVTWDDINSCHDFFCQTTDSFANHTSSSGTKTSHVRRVEKDNPRSSIAPVANGTKYIYIPVTKIDITVPFEAYTGESKVLTANVLPSNATNKKLVWKATDDSMVSINDQTATFLKTGSVSIYAEPADGSRVKYGIAITVLKGTGKETSGQDGTSGNGSTDNTSTGNGQTGDSSGNSSGTNNNSNGTDNSSSGTNNNSSGTSTGAVSVTSVTLSKKSATIVKGNKLTLKATVRPSNAANKNVTWKSNNSKVATVSNSGVVTAVKKGKAVITAATADGSKTATCSITVNNPVRVKSIKFAKKSYSVKKGKTLNLKATIAPKNATNKEVTWKTSNKKVATVDKNGKVKAIKKGKVTITAITKDGKKKAQCQVIIK